MGGTIPSGTFADNFPEETWLLFPEADMAAYPVTEAQLESLSLMAANASGIKPSPSRSPA